MRFFFMHYVWGLSLFCFGFLLMSNHILGQSVYQIYDQLYITSGFNELQKPNLLIVKSSSKAAAYNSLTHIISIEEKALQICRTLGKDSVSAMAYLIAHELSHAFDQISTNESSNFITDQQITKSEEIEEMQADIKGAFLCVLSGFNIEKTIPKLIDKIYKHYRLSDSKSSGYPAKLNRLNSYRQMLAKVNQLIILYESSNLLNLQEEHELAREGYNLILDSYRGPEIYNNIGLTELLESMNWYHNKWDRFVYPLAIDINSALYKAKNSRGELSIENELLRNSKLKKAYAKFQVAHQLNQSYQPAWINIISCLNMMGRPEQALKFIDSLSISSNLKQSGNEESQKLKLAIGITYSLLGRNESKEYFDQCLNSNYIQVSYMAHINLSFINQDPLKNNRNIPCISASVSGVSTSTKVKLERQWILNSTDNRISFSFHRQPQISSMLISGQLGPVLNLYRSKYVPQKNEFIPDRSKFSLGDPNILYMTNTQGEYIKCRSSDIIYRFDRTGKLIEKIWLKKF